jgi:hypothetical protein
MDVFLDIIGMLAFALTSLDFTAMSVIRPAISLIPHAGIRSLQYDLGHAIGRLL